MAGRRHRGTWKRASLVDQVRFPSHQASIFRRSQLNADVRARGRPSGCEYLSAGHGHFHWAPGLARQCSGYRFDVDQSLATESPTNLHGNGADLGHWHIDEACRLIAHIEVPLTA